MTHLTGRILDCQGRPDAQRTGRDLAGRQQRGLHPYQGSATAKITTRTSRASAGSSPVRPASIISAPSSRSLTPAGPATSISRSSKGGKSSLTTQCYVKGEPANERDGIYKAIRDPKAREAVTVDFAPITGSRIGELAARFDVVLGFTPEG